LGGLAALLLTMGAGAVAWAEPGAKPEAARLEAARRLMDATGATRELEQMVPKVMALMQAELERRAPKNKKEVGELLVTLGAKYDARKGELVDKVAQIYATTLSAEDLEAVTRFFSDGPGQRYIKAVPELIKGTQDAGREWSRKLAEDIRRDAEAELRKRKVPLQ
jgi:hypothetical protein